MNTYEKLTSDGVTMIPYPQDIKEAIEAAAADWQIFCSLPDESKQQFSDLNHSTTNGYEQKAGGGPKGDRKENFDISFGYHVPSEAKDISQSFTKNATVALHKVKALADATAQTLEDTFTIPNLAKNTSEGSVFLRFLHYYSDRADDEVVAQTHTDQSGFTFHLHESAEGCVRLDPKTRVWLPMPVASGQAALFGAMQLQLVSKGEIKALAHKVITNPETKKVGRYAVVAFIRLANTLIYDKFRYGRLQEMPDGFNYDMAPDSFAKLFTRN